MGRARSNKNCCHHSFGFWPTPHPYRNDHLYFGKTRWISCIVFFPLSSPVSFGRIEKAKNTQLFLLFPSTNNIFYCCALQGNRRHSSRDYVALRPLLNEGSKLETVYLAVAVLCTVSHTNNTSLPTIPIRLHSSGKFIKKNRSVTPMDTAPYFKASAETISFPYKPYF